MRHRFPVSLCDSSTTTEHRSEGSATYAAEAERILSFNRAEIASQLNLLNLIKTQLTLCLLRPIVRAMDSNLSLLEQKLDQLISLLEKSRSLNEDLRARLTATETRCQQLETQMDAARTKLEQVVAHLPETTSLS